MRARRELAWLDPVVGAHAAKTTPGYHHEHALAFWPATSLATWTRRHCLLRDELEAELFSK
jgi:hypothetical protein